MSVRNALGSKVLRLLIDMDGTLVDSTALVERVWGEFCERHGLDFDELIAFSHGRPTGATTHRFLDDPELAEREACDINEYEAKTTSGIVEIAGASEFVSGLDPHEWALVTSADKKLATARMAAAGVAVPSQCVFAEDIAKGKPDPEPYLLGAKKLGARPEDCVVLEDSAAGIESGLAAGMRVVVVGGHAAKDGTLPRIPDFLGATRESIMRLATAGPAGLVVER